MEKEGVKEQFSWILRDPGTFFSMKRLLKKYTPEQTAKILCVSSHAVRLAMTHEIPLHEDANYDKWCPRCERMITTKNCVVCSVKAFTRNEGKSDQQD